jgi:phosphoribosylformylglycinamidine cyclo-ligase
MAKKESTYKDAGVDISAGNRAVELLKKHVATTIRPEVISGLGGFSGLFALDLQRYRQPVLVSGTDGVGTKLKIAQLTGKHDSVGIDLVAMCVNDILACGAEPLFFLDYLACGKLLPEQVAEVVGGIARGCRDAGCALIGGETAEMPGFYPADEYDLAGFAVGVVDREKIWDGSRITAGDLLIGLPSSGLHSNGFSLVRHILLEEAKLTVADSPDELGRSLGEELLMPTRIYVRTVLALRDRLVDRGMIRGAAHITGGGLTENVPRVLPEGLGVVIRRGSWHVPPVFDLLHRLGQIPDEEMYRVFNMGIGFVLVVSGNEAQASLEALHDMGEEAFPIGQVESGRGVRYE